ncbi:non-hydrolyzing UDP-N-acetylglucosamine 2-epimerase [Crocinitomix catalasitica]|uniref:non-hydrolyzing UDP-N-acetylglucosamine 2-epimerase n=1 Tax=Crocinitomix catalasitica TaxID=184607 RepID=UPI0004874DB9|nr:UDP-N-acetylglucosamine 2-epimerase (non-hydrolyzing) [Crocinitomix catalasitica]
MTYHQKKILIIVGTRPNFIKITQFKTQIKKYPHLQLKIAHTGQHYDHQMSTVFFEELGTIPDYFLNIPQVKSDEQIQLMKVEIEQLITEKYQPDLMIVPGDVNSTLAAAEVAVKMNIPLAHIESGLRSFDNDMPEEFNRKITDSLAKYLFVTEESGIKNLANEMNPGNIYHVGNTMIDTIYHFDTKIESSAIKSTYQIADEFAAMTFHRPSNVDQKESLQKIIEIISMMAASIQVVIPLHPRSKKALEKFDLLPSLLAIENIIITDPLGYFDFQYLIKKAKYILTDSGGIQEEATYRGVPCLTIRENTERPATIEIGTNELVPLNFDIIAKHIKDINHGKFKKGEKPYLWDGKATERIVHIIATEILAK